MHAPDVVRCAVQVEVQAPQRGAERIRQPRRALVVQAVRLAQDVGLRHALGEEDPRFVEVFLDGRDC